MAGFIEGKDELLNRLRRIEGHVPGLQRMVEAETYCSDRPCAGHDDSASRRDNPVADPATRRP